MGMDDINFDELDNAVKSVLQQAPEKEERQESQSDVVEQPGQKEDGDVEPHVAATAVKPAPVIVSRARGQFMDMVHPSSDMTTAPVKRTTASTSTRLSGVMKPLDPSVFEISQSSPEPVVHETVERTPLDEELDAKTDIIQADDRPDQFDVADVTDAQGLAPLEKLRGSDFSEVAGVEESFTTTDDDESSSDELVTEDASESPFIKGTEVEKRPLSAFAETVNQEEENTVADDASSYEGDIPQAVVPAFPQELAPEVVSVEADNPAYEIEESQTETTSPDVLVSSISQQYKPEGAATDDDDAHPVFDTKEYHQPLTPPAKKKHTGLVIVLSLFILALMGAGAWYAVVVLKLI